MTDVVNLNNLSGCYLLATSAMKDKRFRGAAIFIVSHGQDGATGFILNQSLKDVNFTDILTELELLNGHDEFNPITETIVFNGGPLEEQRGFLLHSGEGMEQGTSALVIDTIYLSSSIDILKKIADHEGPIKYRFFLGFCGWGTGQLENELASDGWLIIRATDFDLFSSESNDVYKDLLQFSGINAEFISKAGNA